MKFKDIRVAEGMVFKDISGEEYRTYVYNDGTHITLNDPIAINISTSHGHRLILADGRSVYVKKGWLMFWFGVKDKERMHWRF